MKMSKIFSHAAVAAVALTFAGAANATDFIVGANPTENPNFYVTSTNADGSKLTALFNNSFEVGSTSTGFTDNFLFKTNYAGLGSGNVSTSFTLPTDSLKVTDILVNGISYAGSLVTNDSGTSATISGVPVFGPDIFNTITIVGTVIGSNGYSGNLTFAASPVPEPAAWAMMVLGFGLVGAAARYQRRSTKVVFSL